MTDELDIRSIATDGMLAYRNVFDPLKISSLGYMSSDDSPTPTPTPTPDRSRRRRGGGGGGSSMISISTTKVNPENLVYEVRFKARVSEVNNRAISTETTENNKQRYFKDDAFDFRITKLKVERGILPQVKVENVDSTIKESESPIKVDAVKVETTTPFSVKQVSTKPIVEAKIKISSSLVIKK